MKQKKMTAAQARKALKAAPAWLVHIGRAYRVTDDWTPEAKATADLMRQLAPASGTEVGTLIDALITLEPDPR